MWKRWQMCIRVVWKSQINMEFNKCHIYNGVNFCGHVIYWPATRWFFVIVLYQNVVLNLFKCPHMFFFFLVCPSVCSENFYVPNAFRFIQLWIYNLNHTLYFGFPFHISTFSLHFGLFVLFAHSLQCCCKFYFHPLHCDVYKYVLERLCLCISICMVPMINIRLYLWLFINATNVKKLMNVKWITDSQRLFCNKSEKW